MKQADTVLNIEPNPHVWRQKFNTNNPAWPWSGCTVSRKLQWKLGFILAHRAPVPSFFWGVQWQQNHPDFPGTRRWRCLQSNWKICRDESNFGYPRNMCIKPISARVQTPLQWVYMNPYHCVHDQPPCHRDQMGVYTPAHMKKKHTNQVLQCDLFISQFEVILSLKGWLNHPKKVTQNCQEYVPRSFDIPQSRLPKN